MTDLFSASVVIACQLEEKVPEIWRRFRRIRIINGSSLCRRQLSGARGLSGFLMRNLFTGVAEWLLGRMRFWVLP